MKMTGNSLSTMDTYFTLQRRKILAATDFKGCIPESFYATWRVRRTLLDCLKYDWTSSQVADATKRLAGAPNYYQAEKYLLILWRAYMSECPFAGKILLHFPFSIEFLYNEIATYQKLLEKETERKGEEYAKMFRESLQQAISLLMQFDPFDVATFVIRRIQYWENRENAVATFQQELTILRFLEFEGFAFFISQIKTFKPETRDLLKPEIQNIVAERGWKNNLLQVGKEFQNLAKVNI